MPGEIHRINCFGNNRRVFAKNIIFMRCNGVSPSHKITAIIYLSVYLKEIAIEPAETIYFLQIKIENEAYVYKVQNIK